MWHGQLANPNAKGNIVEIYNALSIELSDGAYPRHPAIGVDSEHFSIVLQKSSKLVANRPRKRRRGFTLVELLVVITIIAIVSAVALPVIISSLGRSQMSESARVLQAGLAGARDAAIRDNAPSGIRLIADPIVVGAYTRFVPIKAAPQYTDGLVNTWNGSLPAGVASLPYPGPTTTAVPSPTYASTTVLMVYQQFADSKGLPNPPTSWFWNVRIGDRIQIGIAGARYTIVGPMSVPNAELFVNVGMPGAMSPFSDASGNACDLLLLTNGLDDNGDGVVDLGWNGVDDNGDNQVDDIGEWSFAAKLAYFNLAGQLLAANDPLPEVENWRGSLLASPAVGETYAIRRRPIRPRMPARSRCPAMS